MMQNVNWLAVILILGTIAICTVIVLMTPMVGVIDIGVENKGIAGTLVNVIGVVVVLGLAFFGFDATSKVKGKHARAY